MINYKYKTKLFVFVAVIAVVSFLVVLCSCTPEQQNSPQPDYHNLKIGESAEVNLASDGPHLYNITVESITPGIVDTYGGKTKTYAKIKVKVKNCSDATVYAGLQSKVYFENESGQMSMTSYFPHEDKTEREASSSRLSPGGEAEYSLYYEGNFNKIDLCYDKDGEVVAS